MIRHAVGLQDYADTVRRLHETDPFACRVVSLFRCYPPRLPFADYWLITDDRGNANGAAARSGTDFVLFLTEKTDLREVASFLQMAGAERALCDGGFTLTGLQNIRRGALLRIGQPVAVSRDLPMVQPSLQETYALLQSCKSESFSPPQWEDFYVDMNHKLRHGAVRLQGVTDKTGLCAVGMTVAETERCAVLGAVACRPDCRRRGYGTQVVGSLVNVLLAEGKTVWLHRAQHENEAFYAAMGFAESGSWKEYTYHRG